MKNDYKFDYIKNTLTLNASFVKRLNEGDKEAREIFNTAKADGMAIIQKTHKTPKSYHNSNGQITSRNQYKNLTYQKMEQFISALPNSKDYLEPFNYLRSGAVASIQSSGYTTVRKWFEKQFPLYRTNPLFYLYNAPIVLNAEKFITSLNTEKSIVANF